MSSTVTVLVQVDVLPAWSVTVKVMVLPVPSRFNPLPAGGTCITDAMLLQLSVAVSPEVRSVTSALQSFTVTPGGHCDMTGGVLSDMVMVEVQDAVFPEASPTVSVTVRDPI